MGKMDGMREEGRWEGEVEGEGEGWKGDMNEGKIGREGGGW